MKKIIILSFFISSSMMQAITEKQLAMISAFFTERPELDTMSQAWKERRKKKNEDRQRQQRDAIIEKKRK
jgi:hypothetical protein